MKVNKISINMRFSGSVGNNAGWKTVEVGAEADLTPTEAKSWELNQDELATKLKSQLIKLWRSKSASTEDE